MNVRLIGHHVCTRTFSNLKSKHGKDSSGLNLTQLVILVCYKVLEFINLHLTIFVSMQRHLRAWNRDAFRFLTRKLSFAQLSWNPLP